MTKPDAGSGGSYLLVACDAEGAADGARRDGVVLDRLRRVDGGPGRVRVEVFLYEVCVGVAEIVDLAGGCDVEAVPPAGAAFAVVPLDHALPADAARGHADLGDLGRVARLAAGDAALHVRRHDVAARAVEDGFADAGVCGAECLPVAEGGVEGGDVAVADEDGREWDLGSARVEDVLAYDLCAEGGQVVASVALAADVDFGVLVSLLEELGHEYL